MNREKPSILFSDPYRTSLFPQRGHGLHDGRPVLDLTSPNKWEMLGGKSTQSPKEIVIVLSLQQPADNRAIPPTEKDKRLANSGTPTIATSIADLVRGQKGHITPFVAGAIALGGITLATGTFFLGKEVFASGNPTPQSRDIGSFNNSFNQEQLKINPREVFDNGAERIEISKENTSPITTQEELNQIPDTDGQGRPIFFFPLGGNLNNIEVVKEGHGMTSLRTIEPNTPLIASHDGFAAAFRMERDGKIIAVSVAITFMGEDGILYYYPIITQSHKDDLGGLMVLDSIPSIPIAKEGGAYYDYKKGLIVKRGDVLGYTLKTIKDLTIGLRGGLNGVLDGPEGNAVVDIVFSTTQDGKLRIMQPHN